MCNTFDLIRSLLVVSVTSVCVLKREMLKGFSFCQPICCEFFCFLNVVSSVFLYLYFAAGWRLICRVLEEHDCSWPNSAVSDPFVCLLTASNGANLGRLRKEHNNRSWNWWRLLIAVVGLVEEDLRVQDEVELGLWNQPLVLTWHLDKVCNILSTKHVPFLRFLLKKGMWLSDGWWGRESPNHQYVFSRRIVTFSCCSNWKPESWQLFPW